MDAREARTTPLSRLKRESDEEVDPAGNRIIRHVGEGASLTSRVDRQGRLLRQELLLDTEVLVWQHGTRIRTGICLDGNVSGGTQYDPSPSRTRLERARVASQAYTGQDKYIRHLARVIVLSAGLAMGGAEVVTHSDGVRRKKKAQDASRQRAVLLAVGGVLVSVLAAYLLFRSR